MLTHEPMAFIVVMVPPIWLLIVIYFTRPLSAARACWLYVCQQAKLEEKQRQQVDHIRKGHRDLETT